MRGVLRATLAHPLKRVKTVPLQLFYSFIVLFDFRPITDLVFEVQPVHISWVP
jgi:hypothetical protein